MVKLDSYKLFTSINMMRRSFYALGEKYVKGITANEDVCMENILNSVTIVTSLNPILGYEKCSVLAKEAFETNRRVYDLVLEKDLIPKDDLDRLLLPKNMVNNY